MSGPTQKTQTKVIAFHVQGKGDSASFKARPSLNELAALLDTPGGEAGTVVKAKLKRRDGEREMRLYLGSNRGMDPFHKAGRRKAAAVLALEAVIDQFALFPEADGALRDIRAELKRPGDIGTGALKKSLHELQTVVMPDEDEYRNICTLCDMHDDAFDNWCAMHAPRGMNRQQKAARKKDLTLVRQYFQARIQRVGLTLGEESAAEDQPWIKIVKEHKGGDVSENTIAIKDVALAFERLTTEHYGLEPLGEDKTLLALCEAGEAFLKNRPVFSDEAFGRRDVRSVLDTLRPDEDAKDRPNDAIHMLASYLSSPKAKDIASNNRARTWEPTIDAFVDHICADSDVLARYLCTTSFDVASSIGSALLDDRLRLETQNHKRRNEATHKDLADNAWSAALALEADIRTAVLAKAKEQKRLIRQKEAVARFKQGITEIWSATIGQAPKFFQVHRRRIAVEACPSGNKPTQDETAKMLRNTPQTAEMRRAVLKEARRQQEIAKTVPAAVAKPQGFAVLDDDPSQIGLVTEASQYGDAAHVIQTLKTLHSGERKRFEGEFRMEMIGRAAAALNALHQKGIACIDAGPENMMVFRNASGVKGASPALDIRFSNMRHATESRVLSVNTDAPDFRSQAPEWINGDPVAGFDPKKADAWALGVFIYQLLSADGKRPFQAHDPAAMKTLLLIYQQKAAHDRQIAGDRPGQASRLTSDQRLLRIYAEKPGGQIAGNGPDPKVLKGMDKLAGLLDPDPEKRMTVAQAFKHIQRLERNDGGHGTFIKSTKTENLDAIWERCDVVTPKVPVVATNAGGGLASARKAAPTGKQVKKKAVRTEPGSPEKASPGKASPEGTKLVTPSEKALPGSGIPRSPLSRRMSQQILPVPVEDIRRPSDETSSSLVQSSSEEASQADEQRVTPTPPPRERPPTQSKGPSAREKVSAAPTTKLPSTTLSPARPNTENNVKHDAKPASGEASANRAKQPSIGKFPEALKPMLQWKYDQWSAFYPDDPARIRDLAIWLRAYSGGGNAPQPPGKNVAKKGIPSSASAIPSIAEVVDIFGGVGKIDPEKQDWEWRTSYEATHSALMDFYEELEFLGEFRLLGSVDGTDAEYVSRSESTSESS